jgi:hypothetical protein
VIGVVVRVGEEFGMGGMSGTIVTHDAVKMTGMKDAVQHLGHRVGRVGSVINLEKEHETALDPFLGGKLLYIQMASATTRAAMICNEDGSGFFLGDEGRLCDEETKVNEKLTEVLYVFSRIASGDNFGFRRR